MNPDKKAKLEAAGYTVGAAEQFANERAGRERQAMAAYLPQSTVSATFVNETAARLFADLWYKRNADELQVEGCKVSAHFAKGGQMWDRFLTAAAWFKLAAEHAAQIAEEK